MHTECRPLNRKQLKLILVGKIISCSLFRFARKLVVSDLYRLPEVVAVREQGGNRLVCLLSNSLVRHSPLSSSESHHGSSTGGSPVVFEELEYHEPVCKRHYTQRDFR